MRLLLAFIFSISVYSSYGQEFTKLDHQREFHGFRFGSSASQYDNDLVLDLTISYGIKTYKYKGKSLKKFEGFKTHDINLSFENDKLNYLDIYLKKLSDEEFDILLKRLENKYGPSISFNALDKGVTTAVTWKGNRITLQLYRYNENTIDVYDQNMTVFTITVQ